MQTTEPVSTHPQLEVLAREMQAAYEELLRASAVQAMCTSLAGQLLGHR